MITMAHRPKFLPQISMPIHEILSRLDEEEIEYEITQLDPNELNPSQGIVFSDEIHEPKEEKYTWADKDNNVLDGHHNLSFHLINSKPVNCVKINLDSRTACRILNKFQDIFDYETQRKMEEVLGQDALNSNNDIDSGENQGDFLDLLEKDNINIASSGETGAKNPTTVIGYRIDPVNENSVIGNFFTLKPIEGYNKFQIDCDNLLDTNDLGITYKSGQVPVEILAKTWFPHVNFEKLSEEYGMPAINLKNKAVAHKANKFGYDAIKYGDTLIQGLK